MYVFQKKKTSKPCRMTSEEKIAKRKEKYEEPLKEYGELIQLKRIVGITRLNRINAANRLQRTENFLQGINIYYSCYTAVLSVLGLVVDNKSLSVWSAALTVILAISIVYLNAQKYGSRAQELQTNYIAIHRLLFDIEKAEATNDTEKLKYFYDRYCELLQTSENHISLDYLKQMKQRGELKASENIEYLCALTVRGIIKLLLIFIPIIISVILASQGMFNSVLW